MTAGPDFKWASKPHIRHGSSTLPRPSLDRALLCSSIIVNILGPRPAWHTDKDRCNLYGSMRRIQCACVHTYYYAAIVLVIALLTSGQDVDLCAKDSGCTCSESAPSVQPDDTVNHNGTAYEFFNTPATWCDAEQACRERSGNLASLLTVEGE